MFRRLTAFIEKAYSIDLTSGKTKIDTGVIQNGNKSKKIGQKEKVQIGDLIFKREILQNLPFGTMHSRIIFSLGHYRYWCPKCETLLTEGPSGGLAVNAVCDKCRVNYGCLPGYWGD